MDSSVPISFWSFSFRVSTSLANSRDLTCSFWSRQRRRCSWLTSCFSACSYRESSLFAASSSSVRARDLFCSSLNFFSKDSKSSSTFNSSPSNTSLSRTSNSLTLAFIVSSSPSSILVTSLSRSKLHFRELQSCLLLTKASSIRSNSLILPLRLSTSTFKLRQWLTSLTSLRSRSRHWSPMRISSSSFPSISTTLLLSTSTSDRRLRAVMLSWLLLKMETWLWCSTSKCRDLSSSSFALGKIKEERVVVPLGLEGVSLQGTEDPPWSTETIMGPQILSRNKRSSRDRSSLVRLPSHLSLLSRMSFFWIGSEKHWRPHKARYMSKQPGPWLSDGCESEEETEEKKQPTITKAKPEKRKKITEKTVQAKKKKKSEQIECITPQKKEAEAEKSTKPKKKRKKKKKTITDVLATSEPKPGSPADLQNLITQYFSDKRSVIEQEELKLQDSCFLSSNDLTHSLSSYLKQVCPKWAKIQKQHTVKSSVVLLIVCSSALRAIELIKYVTHWQLTTFKDGLNLEALKYVVLDWNWRDQKLRRMGDIPEIKLDFMKLLESGILNGCKEDKSPTEGPSHGQREGQAWALARRPDNSAFKQQRLPAWSPMLTANTVLPFFYFMALICMLLGVWLLLTVQSTQEIKGDVFFYYGLKNFHQNLRRYMDSRDDGQMVGRKTNLKNPSQYCKPFSKDQKGRPIAPCGAVANSIFNVPVPLLRSGITWYTDKNVKYRNPRTDNLTLPEVFEGTVKPLYWHKPVYELDPRNPTNNGFINDDLIIWMREAAFPNFKKLYGVLLRANKPFTKGLPPGNYSISITYNFPVQYFRGRKEVVLTTLTWFGGQNHFLPIAYLVTSSLTLLIAVVLTVVWIKFGKNGKSMEE
ncbi:hypothetical protein INR49_010229 [Caranx melampygus]|nr:hypothetical protein INR49_010229 [Caranx melampygus]